MLKSFHHSGHPKTKAEFSKLLTERLSSQTGLFSTNVKKKIKSLCLSCVIHVRLSALPTC